MIRVDEADFIVAVKKYYTIADVLRHFNIDTAQGHYYKWFHDKIKELNVDVSHFTGKRHGKSGFINKKPIQYYLVENYPFSSLSWLRKRLIEEGFLENKCYVCGLINEWNKKPITLELDHINGRHSDNRIENLRIICPNCHSQEETTKKVKKQTRCLDCNISIHRSSTLCKPCAVKKLPPPKPKIDWPSVEELLGMLKETNFEVTAKSLGISSNAIRKHLKTRGVIFKPWSHETIYINKDSVV